MATAEFARSAVLSLLAKSAKRFMQLKNVEDFVCKWYPSLEMEVVSAARACAHDFAPVTKYSLFSNSSIILPGDGLLLELHALTLAARSYALLFYVTSSQNEGLQYENASEKLQCTVDHEIFEVKIVRVLNFHVKNISPPDASAMWRAYLHFIFACLIFVA